MDEKEALKELSKRIDEVSDSNDIPRMRSKDMVIAAVFAAVCLIGVILGGIFL